MSGNKLITICTPLHVTDLATTVYTLGELIGSHIPEFESLIGCAPPWCKGIGLVRRPCKGFHCSHMFF